MASRLRTTRPLIESGRLDEADARLLVAVERTDPGSYRVQALTGLGRTAQMRGDLDSALVLFREAVDIGESSLRDNHRLLQEPRRGLAEVLIDLGRSEEASAILAAVLEIERATRPSPHYRLGDTFVLMARIERARGSNGVALRLLRDAIDEYRELPADHWRVGRARRLLREAGGQG